MSVERWLRLIAGVFVMGTVTLGWFVNPWWFAFTAFVGLNLFQSAFTNWCPMVWILEKLGARRESASRPTGHMTPQTHRWLKQGGVWTMKWLLFGIGFALLALAVAGLMSAAGANPEKEPADYTRATEKPYTETLNAVQEAAKAQGFRVSGVHDLAASLKKEGYTRDPYAVVEVCKAELSSQVLKAEPRFGAFMPCRIAVYQEGSGSVVTTVLPTRLMAFFPGKPEVQAAAVEVDRVMKAIIDSATRQP